MILLAFCFGLVIFILYFWFQTRYAYNLDNPVLSSVVVPEGGENTPVPNYEVFFFVDKGNIGRFGHACFTVCENLGSGRNWRPPIGACPEFNGEGLFIQILKMLTGTAVGTIKKETHLEVMPNLPMLDIYVHRATYERVLRIYAEEAARAEAPNGYQLGLRDCVSLTERVAAALKDEPGFVYVERRRYEIPADYINRLLLANVRGAHRVR